MNTHDRIELPPLPESRIVSYQIDSTMRRMELRTYSDEDMRDYARAAIEADRKRRGGLHIHCQGTNCWAINGSEHSPECIAEAAEAQGWADAPEAVEAKDAINRRGEPDFFTYVINGHHRGISETAPPDDSYDEGTLQPLYTAPQPPRIPEGWQLVPKEPTQEMLFACEGAGSISNHQRGKRIYAAMLAAAPKLENTP